MAGNLSLLNKSIYYWQWYLLQADVDNLIAAGTFMSDYRKSGGTLHQETEEAINKEVVRIAGPVKSVKVINPPIQLTDKPANDIFGMSWDELEAKQGGKLTRL